MTEIEAALASAAELSACAGGGKLTGIGAAACKVVALGWLALAPRSLARASRAAKARRSSATA